MIESITISNFRSLGEGVTLYLGPFTALVGPNGSGKSNAVDALRFIAHSMEMGLSGAITDRQGINAVRRWSGGHPFNLSMSLRLKLTSGSAAYRFELAGDRVDEYRVKTEQAQVYNGGQRHQFVARGGKWIGPEGLSPQLDPQSLALPLVGGDARFKDLVNALKRISIYTIFPDSLRAPQKYDPRKPMEQHGKNWASILKDQNQESWKPELLEALSRLTGDIEDIEVKQTAGYLVTRFRHKSETRSKKWFSAAQESDGTLRVAGIVTALLQDPPLPVVGVEEPELTVHPGAIPLLLDYLRQGSKRSQVIITTHSPELLDLLDVDQVRVVTRVNGATRVEPMAEPDRKSVKEGLLSLGDLLTSGALAAQPELPIQG